MKQRSMQRQIDQVVASIGARNAAGLRKVVVVLKEDDAALLFKLLSQIPLEPSDVRLAVPAVHHGVFQIVKDQLVEQFKLLAH